MQIDINPITKTEFADFAYSFCLFTLHRAYGSLVGREAADRLHKECTGLSLDGRKKLKQCTAFTETNFDSLPSPADIQKQIMEEIMRLQFPYEAIQQTLSSLNESQIRMTRLQQACNFMRGNLNRLSIGLVTFSMNHGGLMITLHISERKRIWLLRILRTALLSIVMSRGNLRSSYVLFSLFSVAWILQRLARFATRLWRLSGTDSETNIISEVDEVTSQESFDDQIQRSTSWRIFRTKIFHFLRLSVFFIAAFCLSLNPNYHP